MLNRTRCVQRVVALSQTVALLVIGTAAQAHSVGSPGGGNREPINFAAGTPFSNSTWTPALNAHIPGVANGKGLGKHGMELDLSNDPAGLATNIDLGHGLIHGHRSVTITFDNSTTQTFTAGESVTAAEFVAILEVLADRGRGTQTLQLDPTGFAAGGTFSLNGLISPRITLLVIPQNVTALDNIAKNPLMGMQGDLTNNGTIEAYSTRDRIQTGLIYSSDRVGNGGVITNNGLISTVPTGLPAGTDALSKINLVLAADNTITNNGTILGSGDLKFATAYGAISNGTTGLINAQGDVILLPGANPQNTPLTATVTNYGTINSTTGNIHINSPLENANIVINGVTTGGSPTVGTMEAFSGYVNVRESGYSGSGSTLINGGSFQGDNGGFNIFSGSANIVANSANIVTTGTSAFQSSLFSFNTTGIVDVQDSLSGGVTVGPSTGGAVSVAVGGNTTLTTLSATNGNLTVSTSAGVLRTVPYAQIFATGNLTLQNLDGGGTPPNGMLIIGTGSSLTAGGNVTLAVNSDTTISAPTQVTSITNVSINGSGVFTNGAAVNPITANLPTNTFNTAGSGQIILFYDTTNSNGTNGNGAIQVQGAVNVSAGAPVGYTQASRPDEMIVDSSLDAE